MEPVVRGGLRHARRDRCMRRTKGLRGQTKGTFHRALRGQFYHGVDTEDAVNSPSFATVASRLPPAPRVLPSIRADLSKYEARRTSSPASALISSVAPLYEVRALRPGRAPDKRYRYVRREQNQRRTPAIAVSNSAPRGSPIRRV